MGGILYWIIITIVLADFIFGVWLQVLSIQASKSPIPKVLQGLYDEDKYARQQEYFRINHQMEFITSSLSTIITLAFFAFGGFAWLDSFSRGVAGSPVPTALCFFAVIYAANWLLSLPVGAYDTFVVEERFGFNKSTPKLFILDSLKEFILMAVLGGALISLCVWLYNLSPRWFWLIAWGAVTLFSLFFQYFYSELIVPLFNKQKPLEEGELRDAIESFASKAGFELENIYVMDASKRSTKANAYFTGFGKKKRVVLFDTLIEQLSTDEIVGVLAHEIGHYKHGHMWKGMVSAIVTNLLTFWLFSLVINNIHFAQAAGCSEPSFWVNMTVFSLLLSPLDLVLNVVSNIISRKHERQADAFAKKYGYGKPEASGLKKISSQALSNLTPHPVVVFVEHSHPTLAERVEFLEND